MQVAPRKSQCLRNVVNLQRSFGVLINKIQCPNDQLVFNGNQFAAVQRVDFLRQLFVKLPEQAVGLGDTWKYATPDTISAQGMSLITKPDMLFKVVGTEKVKGYDCLKITFEGAGTVYGTGSRQGMEMVIDGTTKSKGTTYFAPKEGLLVSVETESTSDMNISGTGEQMFTATQSTTSAQKMMLAK